MGVEEKVASKGFLDTTSSVLGLATASLSLFNLYKGISSVTIDPKESYRQQLRWHHEWNQEQEEKLRKRRSYDHSGHGNANH